MKERLIMTRHWLFIAIYIFFIGGITFLVATYSAAEKVVSFLGDQKEELQNDNLKLLSAAVVANRNDGTEAYIKIEPLYQEHFQSNTAEIEVYIYALVEFQGNSGNNSVAILLKNLDVGIVDVTLDEDEYTIIQAEIEFNQVVTIGQTSRQVFKETFITVFDDSTKLILFNYDMLSAPTDIDIKRISITYKLDTGPEILFVDLNNPTYAAVTANDLFDEFSQDRSLVNLTAEHIDILNVYGLSNYATNTDLYYDATLIDLLESYNYHYFINISIEVLILIPITYFVFFHGTVMVKVRDNRAKKKALEAKKIEEIEKEYLNKGK